MMNPSWLDQPATARAGGDWFHVVESPANEILAEMERRTEFRNKVRGALIALLVDPGCIEAPMLMAECSDEEDEKLDHLNKAVETGTGLWNPVAIAQPDFAFWGVVVTRPYMRAIAASGAWHADHGDQDLAAAIYGELLVMNPNDNQGIRHRLAQLVPVAAGPRM